jgi:hypothetical protein
MSTIAIKQRTMGYQAANQRARCANCSHAEEMSKSPFSLHCANGGFMVTAYAICREHVISDRAASPAVKGRGLPQRFSQFQAQKEHPHEKL